MSSSTHSSSPPTSNSSYKIKESSASLIEDVRGNYKTEEQTFGKDGVGDHMPRNKFRSKEDNYIGYQKINEGDHGKPSSSPPSPPTQNDDTFMVDWLGRSLTNKHQQLGGLQISSFILGAVVCGYFAFGGLFFNLVLYLTRVWGQGNASAANNSTNLVGTVYVTCLLGAFLGDAYLGRMFTVAIFLIVYTLGCVMSAVGVTMQEKSNGATSAAFLFASLYVTAVGCGSYQPVIVSLGGDQFNNPKQKARFFSWVFVASNLGVMLALTVLTYVENMGRWALGFWISATSVGFAIMLFLIGVPYLRQVKPGGNPFLRILQVLVSATRKLNVKLDDEGCLYEVPGNKYSILGNCKISHSNSLRWLDKAAIIDEKDNMVEENATPNPWRLCTVTQVEEVKCVMRIIPVVMIGIIYNVANAQLVSFFVVQGDAMESRLWGFKVPPGSMRLFTNLAGIGFPPFYEYLVVPRIRARTGHPKGLTSLQRMGWGIVVIAIAMTIAATLERERLRAPSKLSILWLIPQFTIIGISNSLFIVSQMDFFYTEISYSMRSLGSSLFLLCMGLGNYASTLIVTIVTYVSSLHHSNWIPRHINEGHLDYFYWLLVLLLLLSLVIFIFYASSYKSLQLQTQTSLSIQSPPLMHPSSQPINHKNYSTPAPPDNPSDNP